MSEALSALMKATAKTSPSGRNASAVMEEKNAGEEYVSRPVCGSKNFNSAERDE